jgi:hypothetical protein
VVDGNITDLMAPAIDIHHQRKGMYVKHTALLLQVGRKCFFVTGRGYLGTAPDARVKEGDSTVMTAYLGIPMVIRPEGKYVRLIAFAKIHDLMDDDVWLFPDVEFENITLV